MAVVVRGVGSRGVRRCLVVAWVEPATHTHTHTQQGQLRAGQQAAASAAALSGWLAIQTVSVASVDRGTGGYGPPLLLVYLVFSVHVLGPAAHTAQ